MTKDSKREGSMNQEQLTALRDKIVGDITPLALDQTASTNPTERFNLLLRLIQAGAVNIDIYNAAYSWVRRIEDRDERLASLLTLLEEVDFDAGQLESEPAEIVSTQNEDSSEGNTEQNYDQPQ